MCPSFNSFGSNPSVSQLVWDTDLVIPDGKAIESASGEVGIVGDVSISGSVSAGGNMSTEETLQAAEEVSSALVTAPDITLAGHPLNVITKSVSSKTIVVGDNTLSLVSSQDAKITGTATFVTDNMGTSRFTLSFTATDALGTTTNIKTYNGKKSGSGTWTANVDVAVPAGTTKITVTATSSVSTGQLQSANMTISGYNTSLVF